jgi:hypothetical protein
MSLMTLVLKNDAHSLAMRVTMRLSFQNYTDTPVNGRPSLFRINRVHPMDFSFPRFVGLLLLSL